MDFLETNEKLEYLSKQIKITKKKPSRNYRTEKFNNQSKASLEKLNRRAVKTK